MSAPVEWQMAEALPMRVLTRMWQMLLKALDEVSAAPNTMMAAEMAVIRLTHVADLPSPEELLRKLQGAPTPPPGSGGGELRAKHGRACGGRGGLGCRLGPDIRGSPVRGRRRRWPRMPNPR